MPPRMLIRRSLALFIDWALVALISMVLLYPFVRGHTDQIRYSTESIMISSCWESDAAPQELHDLVAPEQILELTICAKRPFGFWNGLTAELVYHRDPPDTGEPKTTSREKPEQQTQLSMIFPISDHGIPVNPVLPQEFLILFGVIVASAFFVSRKNGKTPGKTIMGLRVINISRRSALSREFWRFAPLVFLALTNAFQIPDFMLPDNPFGWFFWAIIIPLLVFFGWYYIYPMIRWTGALRHDKIAGTQVVRG